MSLPSQVEKFNINVDRVVQLVNGDKNTVVQTDNGPLPSLAKIINDKQQAIDDAVQGQLYLEPLLASATGAAQVGIQGGGTVQQAIVTQQAALGNKEPAIAPPAANAATYYWRGDKTWQPLNKGAVGLSNVNNTADADKPVSIAQANADTQVLASAKTYADGLLSSANPYKTGDIVETARKDLVAPSWIPCDGASYAAGTYPALEVLLGQAGFDSATRLGAISGATAINSAAVAYSPDGTYLVGGSTQASFQWAKRSVDSYTQLAAPASLPAGWARQASWSNDGLYLSMVFDGAPYAKVYKRAGDTLANLTALTGLPASNPNAGVLSPDGVYFAVATNSTSPYLVVYKRTNDVYSVLTTVTTLPGTSSLYKSLCWNKTGTVLYAGGNGGVIRVFSFVNDTLTAMGDYSLATSSDLPYALKVSPDGSMLAIRSNQQATLIQLAQISGTSLTKINIFLDFTAVSASSSLSWSPDGNYIATGCSGASGPYLIVYKRNGVALNKVADYNVVPNSIYDDGVCFSPDGTHLAVGGAQWGTIYKGTPAMVVPNLASSPKTKCYIKTGS